MCLLGRKEKTHRIRQNYNSVVFFVTIIWRYLLKPFVYSRCKCQLKGENERTWQKATFPSRVPWPHCLASIAILYLYTQVDCWFHYFCSCWDWWWELLEGGSDGCLWMWSVYILWMLMPCNSEFFMPVCSVHWFAQDKSSSLIQICNNLPFSKLFFIDWTQERESVWH